MELFRQLDDKLTDGRTELLLKLLSQLKNQSKSYKNVKSVTKMLTMCYIHDTFLLDFLGFSVAITTYQLSVIRPSVCL